MSRPRSWQSEPASQPADQHNSHALVRNLFCLRRSPFSILLSRDFLTFNSATFIFTARSTRESMKEQRCKEMKEQEN